MERIENSSKLKVGNIVIDLKYSESDKKINECMQNILIQKNKRK